MENTPDTKAFEILVKQNHRRLLAYAFTILRQGNVAEDIVQDALIVAYRNLGKFDASRDFGAWVRGIIRMKCHEWARLQRKETLGEETLAALEEQHQSWDRAIEEGRPDPMTALESCLAQLGGALRQVVDLFYMRDESCLAIASILQLTEVSVKKRLQRARESLADCVNRQMRMTESVGE